MLEVHATGLGFPEGPVLLDDGRLAFVDLLHQEVRVLDGGPRATRLARLDGSPNGMRLGPDGALYVANNGGIAPLSLTDLRYADPLIDGRIQRVALDGSVSDAIVELPGPKPWRPNDLAFSPEGEIVFTDPHNWEVLPDAARYGGGALCVGRPGDAARLLARVDGFPNGLAFGPDGALYVGQTTFHRVLRFPWLGDAVDAPEVWAELGEDVNPDGMVWHEGHLVVAGSVGDQVVTLDRDGRTVRRVPTGEGSDPTNLCVVGERLWVTLGLPGQVVSLGLEHVMP